MGRLAIHDYPIVAPFVESCSDTIKKLNCGKLTLPSQHEKSRMPHSQGLSLSLKFTLNIHFIFIWKFCLLHLQD